VTHPNHGTDPNPASYETGTPTGPDDPEQIRRAIEQTQANLSTNVDALAEKVTPGRIVERRVERVRGTALRWKDKVMGSSPVQGPLQPASPGWTPQGGGARDVAGQVTGAVSGTAYSAASTVSDATSSAASGASDMASTAASAVAEAPQMARRQTQGNPLAAGLISFGAGWLIASLLPTTRREQELASQARDRAGELGQPVAEAARQVATEVKDNLAQPAQQAVESVRSTATEAGRTVTDEGRVAAEQVQGQAQESAGNVRQNASPG
jgi:hypothetical protein